MPFDTFTQDTIIIDCDTRSQDTRKGGVKDRFILQFFISTIMLLIIPSVDASGIIEEATNYSQGNLLDFRILIIIYLFHSFDFR